MPDYLLIHPDGSVTEHDGDPRDAVGCHGFSGQNLHDQRRYDEHGAGRTYTTLRLIGCDCAALMRDEHAPNPVATQVIGRLGFPHPGFYGDIALLRIDQEGWDVPLFDDDVAKVRQLVAGSS
jgi:hypothetical protein